MPELWTSILNPRGPNYDAWLRILGNNRVSLMSPHYKLVEIRGEKNVEIYQLNLRGLTLTQRARLVTSIAKNFDVPLSRVEEELQRSGYVIRAADVIVSYDRRAFA